MKFNKKFFLILLSIFFIFLAFLLFKVNYIFIYRCLSVIYLIIGISLQVIAFLNESKCYLIIPSCILIFVGILIHIKFFIIMHHLGFFLPLYFLGFSLGLLEFYYKCNKIKILYYISIVLIAISIFLIFINSFRILFYYLRVGTFFPILIVLIIVIAFYLIYFFIFKSRRNS